MNLIYFKFAIVTGCLIPLFALYPQEKQPKKKRNSIGGEKMKDEYDFSKGKQNPYNKILKQQVTMNIDKDTIQYFKDLSAKNGVPYQTLINFYLMDCAKNGRELQTSWK